MSTYALVDGGHSTAEYLWRNGIRPAHILFSLKDLEESITYCDPEQDSVLFVVSGCTALAYMTVKEVCQLIVNAKNIKKFAIFSNIPITISMLNCPYIFFEGDLMAGKEYYANTAVPFKSVDSLKPVKGDREINKYKMTEADENSVDIGELPKRKYAINFPDPIKREEIVQIDIFEKKE